MKRRLVVLLLGMTMFASLLTGCGKESQLARKVVAADGEGKTPKYVFLFIGDGMSYPQFQSASDYLGALEENDDILSGNKNLSFMDFEVAGSATTYDSTSFCPDSASTATSIASGHKTHSGVINMDESKSESYETIAEKLKEQKDYNVGIITSVNLNHATPAAFYAHQASRGSYYEIGQELIDSDFDYFAGGGLLLSTGKEEDQKDLYAIAEESGYTVADTKAEAEALAEGDKAIVIGEDLADADSISYEIDRAEDSLALKDYVKKGVEVMGTDKGFFMMVEGGKIDWACHANDAATAIGDTIALSDAVSEAVAFAQEHPEETLILVTGDHETGGLTIGYAGTQYDTFFDNVEKQKISYAKYDEDYVKGYREAAVPFEEAMKDVQELFGLTLPENKTAETDETLVLTDYEIEKLRAAYSRTLEGEKEEEPSQEEYLNYGGYEAFSVTVTHLINNKSGIGFTSYSHTGLPVAVFAQGTSANLFAGTYDNTEIYNKMATLLEVE
ncbi:alkaline phosphatase [Lachnospiraceae bacterium OttesenSCG-928-J05]|nr:alkaline phosphatase [Lachnospiraceae bacterium OttesenSCG-928-J05]